ncbi:MAG TPA: EamA family transporter [Longimicrobiales bacterium]|nr:EamA family transporter [Longimicrobiales bacterium]
MNAQHLQPYRRTTARAHAALLLMVLIWGINFPIAKSALTQLDPLAFNALRFPLAALVVFIAISRRGHFVWPAPGERLRILALGILGNIAYQQFFIFGLALTRAGTAAVLLAGTPIVTALLSAALGHERVGPRVWAGLSATVAGIVMVVTFGGHDAGESTLLGDALMIGASCSWALYTVGSRHYIDRYGSVQFTAWTLWVGALGLCLLGLPTVLRTDLGAVTASAWIGVVYAGALSIGLAYLIWYYGVRQIGNTRTAAYSNLTPVVALAASWVALGEVPRWGQVLGAAVIIGGVTLAQARRVRPVLT